MFLKAKHWFVWTIRPLPFQGTGLISLLAAAPALWAVVSKGDYGIMAAACLPGGMGNSSAHQSREREGAASGEPLLAAHLGLGFSILLGRQGGLWFDSLFSVPQEAPKFRAAAARGGGRGPSKG